MLKELRFNNILLLLLIIPILNFAQEKHMALIPMPQIISYSSENFILDKSEGIFYASEELKKEAGFLQKELEKISVKQLIFSRAGNLKSYIKLSIENVEAPLNKADAYSIKVTGKNIDIKGNTPKAVFYGINTLLQLIDSNKNVEGCIITDWPAFAWRGYMIDVGRNYMSMEILKEKIDYLSRYKYNIFHFHLTEDIAWRIEIDQYPQLTAPETMIRNKGKFYSHNEMLELIEYCRERYITLVPEIDMPGHSEAFTRAMGFNMQSDSGLAAVKNILNELLDKYDLPYWHIGADEVKITKKDFLPEVADLLHKRNKKIIGWEPGGNFPENTIRQLWMDDNGKIASKPGIQYIDSRHLYLNHMDPLEAVVTLFYRKISGLSQGNEYAIGGTLCMWHDRKVRSQDDIMNMNPVYPGILSFAERIWKGGGKDGWVAYIDHKNEKEFAAFKDFENRLLHHKKKYFSDKPFPYVKQQDIQWELYGPYENQGDLKKAFEPELNKNFSKPPAQIVTGGTIILRHWWHNLIKAVLENPRDSTTWYAKTRIYSEEEGEFKFWIGFNNFSRSPATDSPPEGQWDEKSSAVWVNGNKIPPPKWINPGMKGKAEVPLTNEDYAFREPTIIKLKKGWNDVLVKAPVGSFKGRDWQNPVKWMFTFVKLN